MLKMDNREDPNKMPIESKYKVKIMRIICMTGVIQSQIFLDWEDFLMTVRALKFYSNQRECILN